MTNRLPKVQKEMTVFDGWMKLVYGDALNEETGIRLLDATVTASTTHEQHQLLQAMTLMGCYNEYNPKKVIAVLKNLIAHNLVNAITFGRKRSPYLEVHLNHNWQENKDLIEELKILKADEFNLVENPVNPHVTLWWD